MLSLNLKRSLVITASLVVLLAGAGTLLAQNKRDAKLARDLSTAGDKAFTARNYAAAAEAYAKSLGLVPNNARAHYYRAAALYELKDYPGAETSFQLALTQGYKPIEVYRLRWYVFYDQKNYDAALSDLTKAGQIEPRNLEFQRGLGAVYFAKGQYEDSLAAYQRALVIDSKNADIYYDIARLQAALGRNPEQGNAAEEAIKRGTRFPGEAYYLLADSQHKQKKLDAAIVSYQKALAAKPENFQAYRSLADIYRGRSEYDAAIRVTRDSLQYFKSNEEIGLIYTDLAWYYSLADQPAAAVEAGRSATTRLPEQYMGFTNLCRALNDSKLYSEAVRACNRALELNPGDGETLYYKGRAFDLLGRKGEATPLYSRAVSGLEKFVADNPEYSDGFYLLGGAYFADNQTDRAIEAYRKCLALNPRFKKAIFNLGNAYVKNKNKAAAQQQYAALLPLDPKLAAILKGEVDKLR